MRTRPMLLLHLVMGVETPGVAGWLPLARNCSQVDEMLQLDTWRCSPGARRAPRCWAWP